MKSVDLDLFPARVKIIDFEPDPALNAKVLEAALTNPSLNDSTTDCNLLRQDYDWVVALRAKFDRGLLSYLRDIQPRWSRAYEVDAYMFLNYSPGPTFVPYHNHVGDADVVAIYYARAAAYAHEDPGHGYYYMDEGLLVLHDPKADAGLDRRGLETGDHYKVYPRENRMVIQPAAVAHSVTPGPGGPARLAVTCNFVINKSLRWANYLTYTLDPAEPPAGPGSG
jgi:hypothetical protein